MMATKFAGMQMPVARADRFNDGETMAEDSTDVNEIAARVTKGADDLYRRIVAPALQRLVRPGDPNLGPSGYEVLFGPPMVAPEVLFVGTQPAGRAELGDLKQPAHRQPMWPAQCVFADTTKKFALAEQMREIFPMDFLERTTGTHRNFFRATAPRIYARWPPALRRETMAFSLEKLKQLIAAFAPRRIIFIGEMAATDVLSAREPFIKRDDGSFMLDSGTCGDIPAMVCRNVSEPQLSAKDLRAIKQHLRRFCQ